MADSTTAIEFVLKQEDAELSGKVTTDAGGRTRFGIAEKFHPGLASTGFYDELDKEDALHAAKEIYEVAYWNPIQGESLTSQDVANRLLSFAVNLGAAQATILLQKALNTIGSAVAEDGVLGKSTVAALNAADPTALISNYRLVLSDFYKGIVARNPKQAPYLEGWMNRVKV